MNNTQSRNQPMVYPNGKKYYIFLVAFMTCLSAFGSFVNDMYIPTLPEMTRFFHCPVPVVQLGLTFGMIGLGLGQVILGPISDKYGRKPVLVGTLILFIIASVVSVFSPTIHFFLGCRLFQGLGASGGYFLARTIPADIYGGRSLAKMMALIGAINGIAPASAPVIGGVVGDTIGWKGVFWILAGFGVLLMILSYKYKESLKPENRYKGKLVDAFSEYKVLLSNRKFMTHVLLKGSALGILFAYISAGPFIFQDHYGYTQTEFGLFMGFNALFIAAGSMIALKFKVLKNAAWIAGLLLMLSTIAQIVQFYFIDKFWPFELLMIPMIFCLGMIFTVSNTLAMNEGRHDAGGASAVIGVMGYIFGATVAPLVGIGNIMHSTAITFGVLALITLGFSFATHRIAPDLDSNS